MKIQPITSYSFKSTNQQSSKRKCEGWDRAATVQDLYEAEDRIIANQEKLIRRQNQNLSAVLSNIVYHQLTKDPEYLQFAKNRVDTFEEESFKK